MKRVLLIIIGLLAITGCGNSKDNIKNFKDTNGKHESYELKGNMKIISNEDEFTYKITVGVKDQKYYRVSLTNTINDHEQIILRNDEGVYVVTPSLNKSFKFMSEWPNNSSQAYLISNLVDDVNKNNKATIKEINGGYEINTTVNYPNNPKLVNEVIKTDSKYNIESVNIMDKDNNILMSVEIKDINYNPKFSNDYFNLDKQVTDTTTNKDNNKGNKTETTTNKNETTTNNTSDCLSRCGEDDNECKKSCENTQNTSNVLEDIVYPLYVPVDTYLSSKDKVETKDGNRVILTFAGVDPFILVEEVASVNSEMEIIPVSGEILQMGSGIGALSNNSLYFTNNGIDYYLTSNTLNENEMMMIAESITNGANLVAGVK